MGRLVADVPLQDADNVQVRPTTDFRLDGVQAITGSGGKHRRYLWREGTALRDPLHEAGGIEDGPCLVEAGGRGCRMIASPARWP